MTEDLRQRMFEKFFTCRFEEQNVKTNNKVGSGETRFIRQPQTKGPNESQEYYI